MGLLVSKKMDMKPVKHIKWPKWK